MQEWQRYQEYLFRNEAMGFALDISRMEFRPSFFDKMAKLSARALDAMEALEGGAIANPDEGRMVGHYWLRAPELAPPEQPELRREIEATLARIRAFALGVHSGAIAAANGEPFRNLLLIGIGGSALGPQFVVDALGGPDQALRVFFMDNTDPDGMDRIFAELGDGLAATLSVVTSKSGGTEETRNGMLEAQAAYANAGLDFGRHAVAVTGEGSRLDQTATAEGWLDRFPMWDWVGGRTSVTSAVGLLPAALLGYDIDGLLRGAREMDAATREREVRRNPAMLLALMWYYAGDGRGERDMVVLPYKDRLSLCAKYLQQLVMESLGKEFDLQGNRVNQGVVVYGNKGSTDQHAYVQQLREGANNFFATFIQVLHDRDGETVEVEPGVTSGDSLLGFLLGTREALAENYRESVTITLDRVDAASLGQLIALYERAVGFYASLIGINAYHQPGVEAGKRAAGAVIKLQKQVVPIVRNAAAPLTAEEVAIAIDAAPQVEMVYHILLHHSANPGRGVKRIPGDGPGDDRFCYDKELTLT